MEQLSGDRLIALARAPDSDSRHRLLLALGDLCARRSFGLSDEARTAEEVFLRLARDAELAVRAELAQRLAATPWAPRALILLLAEDEIEAAEPVLAGSPVLREADLLDIARRLGEAHRRALARRPGLPETVCEAVASPRECSVIRILLANPTAEMAGSALTHCAAAAEQAPDLWETLARRDGLGAEIAALAYRAVGEALRAEIAERYPDVADQVDAHLEAAMQFPQAPRPPVPGLSANERMIEELSQSGGLDGEFLLEAVEEGRLSLFELGMARLSGADVQTLRRALTHHEAPALAMACRAAGLDLRDCALLRRALNRAGQLTGEFGVEARRECAQIYQDHTPESAAARLRVMGADA